MGFFEKPTGAPLLPGRPEPISKERIRRALDSQDYNYGADEDGDIWGGWDNNTFWFVLLGKAQEILVIRGRWDKRLDPQQRAEVLPVLDDWSRQHIFPKPLTVTFAEDNDLRVFGEVAIDCENGITDEQLLLHIEAGIRTCLDMFAEISKQFPNARD
ncbi:MAG: YbjN domain-containing protein [Propionibacteriaceae bacterium]|jgi:hypothetical protein|nr:YbjN domain-containing protein [Propionibacteriaceae bacterium]